MAYSKFMPRVDGLVHPIPHDALGGLPQALWEWIIAHGQEQAWRWLDRHAKLLGQTGNGYFWLHDQLEAHRQDFPTLNKQWQGMPFLGQLAGALLVVENVNQKQWLSERLLVPWPMLSPQLKVHLLKFFHTQVPALCRQLLPQHMGMQSLWHGYAATPPIEYKVTNQVAAATLAAGLSGGQQAQEVAPPPPSREQYFKEARTQSLHMLRVHASLGLPLVCLNTALGKVWELKPYLLVRIEEVRRRVTCWLHQPSEPGSQIPLFLHLDAQGQVVDAHLGEQPVFHWQSLVLKPSHFPIIPPPKPWYYRIQQAKKRVLRYFHSLFFDMHRQTW